MFLGHSVDGKIRWNILHYYIVIV